MAIRRQSLSPTEHAFDGVSVAISGGVKGVRSLACGVVGDDDPCASIGHTISKRCRVIALAGEEGLTDGSDIQQGEGNGDLGNVAGAEPKGPQAAYSVADGVNFCRAATARTADCLAAAPLCRLLTPAGLSPRNCRSSPHRRGRRSPAPQRCASRCRGRSSSSSDCRSWSTARRQPGSPSSGSGEGWMRRVWRSSPFIRGTKGWSGGWLAGLEAGWLA